MEHISNGPDGANLLGFLSAVGTLAVMELTWPGQHPRMRWQKRGEVWRPAWQLDGIVTDEELISGLHQTLTSRRAAPEFALDRLPCAPETFRAFAQQAAENATPANRVMADFAAAFGCELGPRRGEIHDTALRTNRSHEFMRFIRELHDIKIEQVREAVFGPWCYADRCPTLRYDPVDNRQGAQMAGDPGKADIWTVKAANALASEALRFFPCAPRQPWLTTTGFSGNGTNPYFSWPIWTGAIGPQVLASLLNLVELAAVRPAHVQLRARGVAEVFRVQRVSNGRYRNFTPAVSV